VKSGQAARAYPDDTGSDIPVATVDALLRQTGIIRLDTLTQLIDVARVLAAAGPLPAGPRVAVVGNAGGSLVTAADACVAAGLTLADPDPAIHQDLGVGPTKLRHNPLDLGFQASAADLEQVVRALLADEGVDSVLVVCSPSPGNPGPAFEDAIRSARAAVPGTPVVASIFGPHPAVVGEGDIRTAVFAFPDAAAYALGQVTRYTAWRAEPEGVFFLPDGASPVEARAAVGEALVVHGPGWLPPDAAASVLATVGLAPIPSRVVNDTDAAVAAANELGYPVALKAYARDPMAKSAAAGLALDIYGDDHLRATCDRLVASRGERAFPAIVQAMATPGVDVAVTVAEHPLVGPVLALGPGGVAYSAAGAQLQVLPLTDQDAQRCVASSPVGHLLDDQGKARLEDLLLRVGALIEAAPQVQTLALNPVIISADGPAIADALVGVAPAVPDRLPPVRRL
jgi:acyl-CoA synthetase (NDP forming)